MTDDDTAFLASDQALAAMLSIIPALIMINALFVVVFMRFRKKRS
jgi:hypothetical protein